MPEGLDLRPSEAEALEEVSYQLEQAALTLRQTGEF